MLSVFYSIAFRTIAFSLTRSNISAEKSLSVPQYTAVPLFYYTDLCWLAFFFCVFCCLLYINADDDDERTVCSGA